MEFSSEVFVKRSHTQRFPEDMIVIAWMLFCDWGFFKSWIKAKAVKIKGEINADAAMNANI